jgi:ADP-ribose pyrophosphatase
MSPNKEEHDEDDARVKILELVEDYSFKNLFRVIRARLRYQRFDGNMSEEITRVNFERGDSLGVLLYDPGEDVVVLVRQFRYPVYASLEPEVLKEGGAEQAWIPEVVAGIIDPGHSVVEIASNELLEESGYMVRGDLRPIATIYPSPGGSSERIHLFLGLVDQEDRVNEGGGLPGVGEDILVERLPFQEAMSMIDKGKISDAKTIVALQHLALLKTKGTGFQGE